jgi:UV DNA damage endonuclease
MRVGYACINLELRERGIYTTRTLILASIEKKGLEEAKKLALQNIKDLAEVIEHNEREGIRFFRITSNLFPHMENPRIQKLLDDGKSHYNLEYARKDLEKAGALARKYGHRLTMHPGQYAQLGSPNLQVVEQTFRDLNLHAQIFLAMGMKPQLGSVMIIHGGGTFGDKLAALGRWRENFRRMPEEVRQFIAVENDEFQYSVLDLLPLCEELGVPLCVDFFHHSVKHAAEFNIFEPAILNRVLRTWKLRGIKPKCHWSSQRPGARPGTHDDCVESIPRNILQWCAAENVDIMLEVKLKDQCARQILQKQFVRTESEISIEGRPHIRVEWHPRL